MNNTDKLLLGVGIITVVIAGYLMSSGVKYQIIISGSSYAAPTSSSITSNGGNSYTATSSFNYPEWGNVGDNFITSGCIPFKNTVGITADQMQTISGDGNAWASGYGIDIPQTLQEIGQHPTLDVYTSNSWTANGYTVYQYHLTNTVDGGLPNYLIICGAPSYRFSNGQPLPPGDQTLSLSWTVTFTVQQTTTTSTTTPTSTTSSTSTSTQTYSSTTTTTSCPIYQVFQVNPCGTPTTTTTGSTQGYSQTTTTTTSPSQPSNCGFLSSCWWYQLFLPLLKALHLA